MRIGGFLFTAAALCALKGHDSRSLPYVDLRLALEKGGVYFECSPLLTPLAAACSEAAGAAPPPSRSKPWGTGQALLAAAGPGVVHQDLAHQPCRMVAKALQKGRLVLREDLVDAQFVDHLPLRLCGGFGCFQCLCGS